jgi:hypothetical protein
MIDEAQGRIDYDEIGSGPAVVLLPGSCCTGAAWRPVMAASGTRDNQYNLQYPPDRLSVIRVDFGGSAACAILARPQNEHGLRQGS